MNAAELKDLVLEQLVYFVHTNLPAEFYILHKQDISIIKDTSQFSKLNDTDRFKLITVALMNINGTDDFIMYVTEFTELLFEPFYAFKCCALNHIY